MLIELKLTRGPGAYSDVERYAIENVGLLAAFGYHFVTGERGSLIAATRMDMASRAAGAFRRVLSSYATHRAVASRVRVQLVLTDSAPTVSYSRGSWIVPLKLFGDPKLLREGILLAENSEDALFYRGLAKVFQAKHLNSFLPVHLELRGGGGSTVAAELRVLLRDSPRFFLCVVDSDREWSGGKVGSTAKKASEELPAPTWFGSIAVLGVRSIENLVSAVWLGKTETMVHSPELVRAMETIEGSGQELCYFADLKNQSTLCKYRNHADGRVRAAFCGDVGVVAKRVACYGACGAACCLKFGSLKASVMKVAEFFDLHPAMAARGLQDGSIHEELGRQLFEFGVGAPIMRG